MPTFTWRLPFSVLRPQSTCCVSNRRTVRWYLLIAVLIFWQHPVITLSQVNNANKTDGDRRRASRLASNTRSLSGVSPEGRGARHSCRHERDVTYRRSSMTSGRHASALFYMRGGLFVNAARGTGDRSSWYHDYGYFVTFKTFPLFVSLFPTSYLSTVTLFFTFSFPSSLPSSLFYLDSTFVLVHYLLTRIVLYCIVVGSRRLMPPDALQPKAYCTNPGL